jgi:hypothetical protein
VRSYGSRVELLTFAGEHLRWIPAALAAQMVARDIAKIAHQNGKVRSIRLITAATSFARRIGEPTPGWNSAPFVVREKLDCGFVRRA